MPEISKARPGNEIKPESTSDLEGLKKYFNDPNNPDAKNNSAAIQNLLKLLVQRGNSIEKIAAEFRSLQLDPHIISTIAKDLDPKSADAIRLNDISALITFSDVVKAISKSTSLTFDLLRQGIDALTGVSKGLVVDTTIDKETGAKIETTREGAISELLVNYALSNEPKTEQDLAAAQQLAKQAGINGKATAQYVTDKDGTRVAVSADTQVSGLLLHEASNVKEGEEEAYRSNISNVGKVLPKGQAFDKSNKVVEVAQLPMFNAKEVVKIFREIDNEQDPDKRDGMLDSILSFAKQAAAEKQAVAEKKQGNVLPASQSVDGNGLDGPSIPKGPSQGSGARGA